MPLLRKIASSISLSQASVSPVSVSGDSPRSEGVLRPPKYRGPVQYSGWVWKQTGRLRGRTVKRFFDLRNSLLSSYQTEKASPSWTVSVSHAKILTTGGRRMVTVRLRERDLRFIVSTVDEMAGWADALRRGSTCNVTDFYRFGAQLGFGSFGAVKMATHLASGETRAIKVVERTRNAKELEFIARETSVMLAVQHENVVTTHDVFDAGDRVFVIMDFVPHGDLFDLLSARGALPESEARDSMKQILLGVQYLHAQGIVHRDIKPENVLVRQKHPLHLQLTDFGFARFIDSSGGGGGGEEEPMVSVVGTGCYMSPEVIDERGHGRPVDLFACGVVLFRMLTGVLPFEGASLRDFYNQAMMTKTVFEGADWSGVSERGQSLTAAMLDPDPAARPTVDDALRHPWFAGEEVDGDDARPRPTEEVVDRDERGVRKSPSTFMACASAPTMRRHRDTENAQPLAAKFESEI